MLDVGWPLGRTMSMEEGNTQCANRHVQAGGYATRPYFTFVEQRAGYKCRHAMFDISWQMCAGYEKCLHATCNVTDWCVQSTNYRYNLHPTSANLCVQVKGNASKPRVSLADHYFQAKDDVECHGRHCFTVLFRTKVTYKGHTRCRINVV